MNGLIMRNIKIKIFLTLMCLSTGISFAQLPQLTVQTGHTDEITTLAFSNDGRYLASAGKDNLIIIWDFNLGKQIHRLKGHSATINCMKFFSSGNRLASGGNEGHLFIWDIEKDSIVSELPGNNIQNIISFDLAPDEKSLIFCTGQLQINQWSFSNNLVSTPEFESLNSSVLKKYKSDPTSFVSVKFSSNGRRFAICKANGIYIFDLDDPTACSFIMSKELRSGIRLIGPPRLRTSRKVEWMWSDSEIREIIFSDISVNKKMNPPLGLAFSQVVKRDFKTETNLFKRSAEYSKYKFTSGTVNADQSVIAAGNEDNGIYLWDFNTGKKLPGLTEHGNAISVLLFHPDKKNILVSCDSDREILIWDIDEGKIIRKLSSTTSPITALAVDESGNKITFATTDNSVRLFDLSNNVRLNSLEGNRSNISGIAFTSDGKELVTSGTDNKLTFYSSYENRQLHQINGNLNPALYNAILYVPLLSVFANTFTTYFFTKTFVMNDVESLNAMAIMNDRKYTATGGSGFKSGYFYKILSPRLMPIHIIDNQSKQIDFGLKAHYISVDALAFNSEGNILASGGRDFKMRGKTYLESLKDNNSISPFDLNYNEFNAIKIWDIKNRKLTATFENRSPVRSIVFETHSDSLLFADDKKNIVLLDYRTNKAVKLQEGMGPLLFLPDDRSFLFQDQAYSIKQYDIEKKSIIAEFKGHTDKITSAVLIQNGQRLVTGGWDGTLKFWDVLKGNEIVTLYAINTNDFLIKTPDNYYFATKNAVSEIGFTFGMKFYPFEQFDLKYNRPDLVLRQLGNTSEELLAAYYRAYQKRIKKLGFTEEMLSADFHVPEITIANQEAIEPVTDKRNLVLKISARDTKYPLDRINVWINDVALFGRNGLDRRSSQSQSVTEDIDIQLAAGINKIQVSALNLKGAESLKEIVEVNYNAPQVKPDLYLISMGVSKYRDSRFDLNFASKDANDISGLFRGDTSLFRNIYIKTLTDAQVTISRLDEIRSFVQKAGRDDVVMLFIAGHGLLDVSLDYYFGTYDMDFNNPAGKGIVYDDIEELFDGLTALKKILFMDTCFSGEVDKDEVELAQATNTEFGNVTFRSSGTGVRMKQAFGSGNTTEIMKELFTDIRKGTGSTVISSAGGAEFAMEGEQWKNGLFTFCVLNGLNKKAADLNKDGKIMLSELQDYVRNNVTKLSEGKQSPTSRIQNISMDFRIW